MRRLRCNGPLAQTVTRRPPGQHRGGTFDVLDIRPKIEGRIHPDAVEQADIAMIDDQEIFSVDEPPREALFESSGELSARHPRPPKRWSPALAMGVGTTEVRVLAVSAPTGIKEGSCSAAI